MLTLPWRPPCQLLLLQFIPKVVAALLAARPVAVTLGAARLAVAAASPAAASSTAIPVAVAAAAAAASALAAPAWSTPITAALFAAAVAGWQDGLLYAGKCTWQPPKSAAVDVQASSGAVTGRQAVRFRQKVSASISIISPKTVATAKAGTDI